MVSYLDRLSAVFQCECTTLLTLGRIAEIVCLKHARLDDLSWIEHYFQDSRIYRRRQEMTLILIIVLILVLGGGGGYYGYGRWGYGGGAGISLGTILLILLIAYLLGAL